MKPRDDKNEQSAEEVGDGDDTPKNRRRRPRRRREGLHFFSVRR